MDEWVDRWMDGCNISCEFSWMDGCMEFSLKVQKDRQMDVKLDGSANEKYALVTPINKIM